MTVNDSIEECIKAIGENLKNRAKDISQDLDRVTSITIHAEIKRGEIINFDVTKNYAVILNEK